MASLKVQRSYYLTEDQARWLKVEAAKRAITISDLIGGLIEAERNPANKPQTKTTSPSKVKADGENVHEILTRAAKA